MSEQPIVSAVVPEVKDAPAHVVTEVNEHTPDPVTPPVVDQLPDPPAPADGLAELKEVVTGLATAVASLTELVIKANKDESPTKGPWTHRGRPMHEGDE